MSLNFHAMNFYLIMATGMIAPVWIGGLFFPIHTFYIAMYIFFISSVRANFAALARVTLLMTPLLTIFLLQMMRSNDLQYAGAKIEGVFISTIVLSVIAFHAMRRHGSVPFFQAFVRCSLLVLFATLVYRLAMGLELDDRSGRFLINGPIVFGWLMGLNSVLCSFLAIRLKSVNYTFMAFLFLVAVVWTASKGPLIATTGVLSLVMLRYYRNPLVWLSATFLLVAAITTAQFIPAEAFTRIAAVGRVLTGETVEQDYGSIGIRSTAWIDSISMFEQNPWFGVGLGNWDNFSSEKLQYPHNLVMEVLSEMGLLGALGYVAVLVAILYRASFLSVAILMFFFLGLSFSGDSTYHRMLLSLSIALKMVDAHFRLKGTT